MLPNNLGLVGLIQSAAEAESAPQTPPEAEESQQKRKRAPRARPVEVNRRQAKPRTVWVTDATWERLRLAACRKGARLSVLVEELLLKLPDLVLSERDVA